MASSELLPGLPNDLAIHCLAVLPPDLLPRLHRVSSLWSIALRSDRFYVERRRRLPFPSLFLVRLSQQQRFECLDFDLADLCSPRVLFSCDLHTGQGLFPKGSLCAPVGKSVLVVESVDRDPRAVRLFDLLTRKWTTLASKNICPGSDLLLASLDTRLLVLADGSEAPVISSEEQILGCTLPPSFVFDVCFSFQGKVFVRGLRSGAWSGVVFCYDPSKEEWKEDSEMGNRLQKVKGGSKVVARSDGTLVVATMEAEKSTVVLKVQRSGREWQNIAVLHDLCNSDFFMFIDKSEGVDREKIVVVVPTTKTRLNSRRFPFFQGLTLLYVPCFELRLGTMVRAHS